MPFALTRRIGRAALLAIFSALAAGRLWGALEPAQVLILVNRDTAISARVAAMYQKLRAIPDENVLRLSLGTERFLTPEQYSSKAGGPIKKYLEEHPAIRCILTTSGVPYVIQGNGDEGAAFDNELAAVLQNDSSAPKRRQPNPLFVGGTNLYAAGDPRPMKIVFVARLDGPDLTTITRMAEDSNTAWPRASVPFWVTPRARWSFSSAVAVGDPKTAGARLS